MGLNRLNIIPLLTLLFALTGIVLIYSFVYPLYSQYFPKCLFYSFTGLYCPGCGSQRAITALLHLDFTTAAHDNLLAVIAIPFLVYAFAVYCFSKETEKRHSVFYNPLAVKLVILVLIFFAIARNIPLYPFNLLAPLN